MSSNPPWFQLPKCPPVRHDSTTPTIVVGCGLAGCHVAFELASCGVKVILIDAGNTIAAGASGNAAGIVKPFVTRSPARIDQFYTTALQFLLHRLKYNERLNGAAQFTQCGVLQLVERDYPRNDSYSTCSAKQASQLAGVAINSPAIFFKSSGWLNPASLCEALVQHPNIEVRLQQSVQSISRINGAWSVLVQSASTGNAALTTNRNLVCDTLILANGTGLNRLTPTRDLPIVIARGQTSRFAFATDTALKTVVTGKRYAIPDGDNVVVGASFSRDQDHTRLLASEHNDNLDGLQTLLPTLNVVPNANSGFCAIRATTPDRLPVVGPVPDFSYYRKQYARLCDGLAPHRFAAANYEQGLYVIGGFGSRGIVSTPYCARLLVDYIYGSTRQDEASNKPINETLSQWSPQLHPGRFLVRTLKRYRNLTNQRG